MALSALEALSETKGKFRIVIHRESNIQGFLGITEDGKPILGFKDGRDENGRQKYRGLQVDPGAKSFYPIGVAAGISE